MPEWLNEDDTKRFSKSVRKYFINLNQTGRMDFRDVSHCRFSMISFLNSASATNLLQWVMLPNISKNLPEKFATIIPKGFIESLFKLYEITILNEVKEAIFHKRAANHRNYQRLLFALNFELTKLFILLIQTMKLI